MIHVFTQLFDTTGFLPRWECGSWTDAQGWLHILSDLAVWSAYFAIPCILVYFVVRRRDVPFRAIFWLFGAFILACGTTHLMEAIIFWHPLYRLAGVIKLLTAIVSWGTVVALVPIVPKALAMRSPEELEQEVKERTADLARANITVGESERREKERAAELEALMRATPTPIWIALDPQCHRITGNPASCKLLGLPEDTNVSATSPGHEAGMRGFREYRDSTPIPVNELPMQVAASRGVEINGAEVKFVFDDGRVRYIYGNARPLFHADGSVRGAVSAFADVTPLKEAEKALKEADRRKDEFLATLAHELRNPLAPIRNALELMKRADGDANLTEQARILMERQVGQMVRLVDDLLDLNRISRGKVELRKERLELGTQVRNAVEVSRPMMEAQSHELTVTLPPEPIFLDADPTRLSQIISNLLNNAAKYTEKGGHIWLTVERQGGDAVVSIRDTGIGIAADHLPHIFEMFSQAVPALERSQGGLGVGLALVRGLVELHGGTVEAHSGGIGMGSEFIIRLPVAEGPVQTSVESADSSQKARSGPKCRILVVDDNRDTADSLAMVLRLMGHEIQTAHNGVEAVQAAASFRPDVAFLDIGMPKMNGYEVARHIREQPWGTTIVLIALTGWGQEEDKKRASEAGFRHHLTKPVEPGDLGKLLENLTQPRN
jgi:signal transduction histidine kinase/CheY-like chemotaxis protein